jgi:Fe-S-cluster containining protein
MTPIEYLKSRKKNRPAYRTFLRGLIQRKVRGLDSLSIALNKEAFKKIDCLDCANCCTVMSPTYKKSDVKRIAKHLGMSFQQYYDKYLYKDETGDFMNTKTPCQFLKKDKKCSIYPVRPLDCRGFPHTQNKDFKLYISGTHKQNIEYCPATLHVVERLHQIIIEKGHRNLSAALAKEIKQEGTGYSAK